jgi:NTE family protein
MVVAMDERVRGEDALAADLVLEGGGVKGLALVGALMPLIEAGYRFPRIGATSAGAVVGAVLAGLEHRGGSLTDLEEIARSLDYRRFRDLGFLADGASVLLEDGAYEGDYLERWLTGVLADLGVHTFGDLRRDSPGDDPGLRHRWSLVVTASDVSRRRLVRLPWDYGGYGLDPDEQRVAAAVRASSSIPFFFEPVTLRGTHGDVTLVDGGLISNYPIDIFDRRDGRPARWPTVGIRLDSLMGAGASLRPVRGPVHLGVALVQTAIEGCQAEHVLLPCNVRRSVFVDTGDVAAVDFDLTEADKQLLLAAGREASTRFLGEWDYEQWKRDCRPETVG